MNFARPWTPAYDLADEFIPHPMHRAEVYRTGGILLQLLPKLKDVIVYGPGRGVILVSPDFIQEFVPADHPVGILYEELEGLELLGGEHHEFAVALHFHFPEIGRDVIEADDLGF